MLDYERRPFGDSDVSDVFFDDTGDDEGFMGFGRRRKKSKRIGTRRRKTSRPRKRGLFGFRRRTRRIRRRRVTKTKSKGGIKYTKNGQPYKILANGRARFIKGRRRK